MTQPASFSFDVAPMFCVKAMAKLKNTCQAKKFPAPVKIACAPQNHGVHSTPWLGHEPLSPV